MSTRKDPFEVLVVEKESDDFAELADRPVMGSTQAAVTAAGAVTARLHGFDLDEQPMLASIPGLANEIVAARSTVPLLRQHTGATVVVLFDGGDVRRPIVVGVIQDPRSTVQQAPVLAPLVSAQVDDQRIVLTAEREIVLKCGEASITLTRAGKVLIKGRYVLSGSSGYNKIKGAVVDIN
jgi:hypothetical protein